jgi:hypothetical protein
VIRETVGIWAARVVYAVRVGLPIGILAGRRPSSNDHSIILAARQVENTIPGDVIDGACLLCSEATPEHCHRRLVAEYLRDPWGGLEIKHL